jgi:hypothetical protein
MNFLKCICILRFCLYIYIVFNPIITISFTRKPVQHALLKRLQYPSKDKVTNTTIPISVEPGILIS